MVKSCRDVDTDIYVVVTRQAGIGGREEWTKAQGEGTKKVDRIHFEQLTGFRSTGLIHNLMIRYKFLSPVPTSHIAWLGGFHPVTAVCCHGAWKWGLYLNVLSLACVFKISVCWCFQIHVSGKYLYFLTQEAVVFMEQSHWYSSHNTFACA